MVAEDRRRVRQVTGLAAATAASKLVAWLLGRESTAATETKELHHLNIQCQQHLLQQATQHMCRREADTVALALTGWPSMGAERHLNPRFRGDSCIFCHNCTTRVYPLESDNPSDLKGPLALSISSCNIALLLASPWVSCGERFAIVGEQRGAAWA